MSDWDWTILFVVGTFTLYIGIAIWARAGTSDEFYVAGHDVHPILNGMATAADWMSAASFISMAGIIAFAGYDGSVYLMGWTGGFVLLALLLLSLVGVAGLGDVGPDDLAVVIGVSNRIFDMEIDGVKMRVDRGE